MPHQRGKDDGEAEAELHPTPGAALSDGKGKDNGEGAAADDEEEDLTQPQGKLPLGCVRVEAVDEEGQSQLEPVGRQPRPGAGGNATGVGVDVAAEVEGDAEQG